nr:hypothetical protein [Tanacetum cinerariifolium]
MSLNNGLRSLKRLHKCYQSQVALDLGYKVLVRRKEGFRVDFLFFGKKAILMKLGFSNPNSEIQRNNMHQHDYRYREAVDATVERGSNGSLGNLRYCCQDFSTAIGFKNKINAALCNVSTACSCLMLLLRVLVLLGLKADTTVCLVLGWDKDSIKLKMAIFEIIEDVVTKMIDYHIFDVVVEFYRFPYWMKTKRGRRYRDESNLLILWWHDMESLTIGEDLKLGEAVCSKQVEGMTRHKELYIISSHTKKILANMRRIRADFSVVITPLFDTIMVQAPADTGDTPVETQQTPIVDQPSTSKPQKKQKPRRKQRNATKVSNYESEDDDHVPTPSSDPLPSGEDSFILNKLMVFCTSLQEEVLDLQEAKAAQAKEIDS